MAHVSDCHVYSKPLSYDFIEGRVCYQNSAKPEIKDISDLKQYRMKFKTELQYWYYVINHIKEKILIKQKERKSKKQTNKIKTENNNIENKNVS